MTNTYTPKHLVVYTKFGNGWSEEVNGRYNGRVTTYTMVKNFRDRDLLRYHNCVMQYYTR